MASPGKRSETHQIRELRFLYSFIVHPVSLLNRRWKYGADVCPHICGMAVSLMNGLIASSFAFSICTAWISSMAERPAISLKRRSASRLEHEKHDSASPAVIPEAARSRIMSSAIVAA